MMSSYLKSIIIGLGIGCFIILFKLDIFSMPNFNKFRAVNSYSNAIEKSASSVVGISVNFSYDNYNARFNISDTADNSGSGIIISSDGYIITNYHVVMPQNGVSANSKIAVLLRNGHAYYATLVGFDKRTDIAVLKIISNEKLTPIPYNNKRKIHLGDVVLAIGNPYDLGQTVTHGIISAVGRSGSGVNYKNGMDLTPGIQDLIQTDAPINSGNSGGALVNTFGELIGMSTATLENANSKAHGISFAIPTELIFRVVNDIIVHGRVIRGYLGITASDLNEIIRKNGELNSNVTGIVINLVNSSGPSYKILESGDIITKINNVPIQNLKSAMEVIAKSMPESVISFEIIRNGESLQKEVKVSEQPDY